VYVNPLYYPVNCHCFVYPGDTLATISLRAYGNGGLGQYIARYNGLRLNSRLFAGQKLRLPVINSNGTLTASPSPAPAPYLAQAVAQNTTGQAFGSQGVAIVPSTPVTNERSLPAAAVGSVLMLDGQALGTEKGMVRLRIGALALPVEIVEWSPSAAKVQLPQLDLNAATNAELEVVRADGSVASKSTVKLTPAATRLAFGN
jgi:hypothetical protein